MINIYSTNISTQTFTGGSPKISIQQLKEFADKGLSDKEIAKISGLSRPTICKMRNKAGIKTLHKTKLNETLKELIAQGYNDVQIGNIFGVTKQAIAYRRNILGIKKEKIDDNDIIKLVKEGYNDVQIAQKLGYSRNTIRVHRNKLGLKISNRELINYDEFDFYYLRTLIDEGNSLSQIAKFYKQSVSLIRKVLSHFNLKTQETVLAESVKKEELIKLIMEGKTTKEIADALFLENELTVKHLIKKFGINTSIHKANQTITAEKIMNLIFYRGLTPEEIAQKYNIDISVISQQLKISGFDEIYKACRLGFQPNNNY